MKLAFMLTKMVSGGQINIVEEIEISDDSVSICLDEMDKEKILTFVESLKMAIHLDPRNK
jgi:hypothetical protein